TITVDSAKLVTAVFVEETPVEYVLSVSVEGSGSVTKSPDKPAYSAGTEVTLTAVAADGWVFDHWVGDLSGSANPATITVDSAKLVTAVFVEETLGSWWNTAWQYRRAIVIDHTKVSGTLIDFPVLIELLDSSLLGKTQSNGYDFVFTSANGLKLAHQIEFYDATIGHLIAWVRVPYLSSIADTTLYIYYGNQICDNQQNPVAVWDENTKLVLHLNEQTGIHYDSTANGNNGTPFKGVLQGVSGKIDGADWFDGRTDYIEVPHSDTLASYTEGLTVSFWIKFEDTSRIQSILCKYNTAGNMRSWQIEYDANNPANPFCFYASKDGITYSRWYASFIPVVGIWYHITIVWETNAIPKFYINGVPVPVVGADTIPSIFNNVGTPLWIGRNIYAVRCFTGLLDEIHISNVTRSSYFVSTMYNNQLNPHAFYSLEAEEIFQ
ncbi:MAG: DUF2341 domain-containing protein, partial [Candidatus Bathyarchaeota archaeon]|nr:DUF2341 domain-containing protein [Candidatus Bathyarchaeota archaeon]